MIGRCPWSIRVQIHCSTWGAVLNMSVRLFPIKASEILEKCSTGAIYKKEKWKRGQKELLTTLKCLNYKKSSPQVPSCFIAMRDSPFFIMFSPLFCYEQGNTRFSSLCHRFEQPRCTCDFYTNSFYPRTIAQWNNLPPETIVSTSPCSLRQSLCNLTYWFVFLCYCCIHCCNFNYLKQSAILCWEWRLKLVSK